MAHEVFIPKTGIYMDDCHLIAWLVDEGASIRAGDALFLMETNKVEMEIEAGAGRDRASCGPGRRGLPDRDG